MRKFSKRGGEAGTGGGMPPCQGTSSGRAERAGSAAETRSATSTPKMETWGVRGAVKSKHPGGYQGKSHGESPVGNPVGQKQRVSPRLEEERDPQGLENSSPNRPPATTKSNFEQYKHFCCKAINMKEKETGELTGELLKKILDRWNRRDPRREVAQVIRNFRVKSAPG